MADNVIVRVPEQQFIRGEDGYSPEVTIEDIAHGHSVTITDREHQEEGQTFNVLDGDSAYEQAVAGGYTGTEAQFNEELSSFKELSDETKEAAPFYAEYGVTTKAEIEAAINGKRQIYAYQSLSPYPPILPYVGKIHYDDEQGSCTGYRFSLIEGTTQTVYELTSTWAYRTNNLSEPAQRAEAAAAQALIRMNSADQSAQSAAGSASNASRDAGTASTAATTATEKAGEASDSATAADGSAKDAEAYAVGKRGGTDVGSTDPAYHNNSKYYAEQAAGSATAAGNAQTAAETAQSAAEDAQEAAEAVLASIPSDYTELIEDVADLKSAFDKELKSSHFSPTLYVSGSDYYYFDTGILKMSKSSSKKYLSMRYVNAIRPDYISVRCDVENIKYKIVYFGSPASATTSGSTVYIGSTPYATGDIAFPPETKNFLISFTTIDGTAITSEQITAILNNLVINRLADTNFVRGKTEMGGISNSGYNTNADVWQNTRSEKMYKVVGDGQITIVFDTELPSYFNKLTVFFYDENGEYLSNSTLNMNTETGFLPAFTMPDGALYFKLLVVGNTYTNVKRHEYFTICTRNQINEVYNPNIINTTVSGSLAFCYEITPDAETSGRLLLPPNYTVDGDKVPLIVFVHGSGCMTSWSAVMGAVTDAGQNLSYLPYLQYLANEGFAVFDCYPWSNKETVQSGTYSPFIAPVNIASYMRGIEYVCSRYNVDKTKVSMLCKSQGGHIGNWAIMQKQFPFRTVSMFAPSCGIGLSSLFASSKCREVLTKYIAFDGSSEEISAFITNGSISNANVASFVNKNKGKLLSMCPMAQGITNGSLDTLLDGCTHGQSTVPQWMLDLGLPTKPEGAIDLYTLSNNNEYVKNGSIPSKFWVAFDDEQVSGYSIFATYYWLCNGASDTEFRQLPNGTGGHHAMDTDPDALKSSGTTVLGIAYADIPTAYVEVVEFIRSRFGD